MLGFKAPDGRTLTSQDYAVKQQFLNIGTIAGYKIVQILTTIRPGQRVIAAGFASNHDDAEWKDLLVSLGDTGGYVELYSLRFDGTGLQKITTAAIYGSGDNAILGTYDPGTGNGGGCSDGYWWFDQVGAHNVDFAPLIQAATAAIPQNATFTRNCWALDPETSQLKSWVQLKDADCHACGGLGEVLASYRIEQGAARPVSVVFRPSSD